MEISMEITKDTYDKLFNIVKKIRNYSIIMSQLDTIEKKLSSAVVYSGQTYKDESLDINYDILEKYKNENINMHKELSIVESDLIKVTRQRKALYKDLNEILLSIYKDYCIKNPEFSTIKISTNYCFNSKESVESITTRLDIMSHLKLFIDDEYARPCINDSMIIFPDCRVRSHTFEQSVKIVINPTDVTIINLRSVQVL
jgi:hypothetical protein